MGVTHKWMTKDDRMSIHRPFDDKARAWRAAIMLRDGRTCQCGQRARHAHHIKSWIDYPELRYDVSNGVALCEICHSKKHGQYYDWYAQLGQSKPINQWSYRSIVT